MNGTKEQEEIWKEMENGNDHMMVYAGAGTGKTYTIVAGAKLVDGKKGFLAFNKSIATELQERLPDDCDAMTFHSLGYSAVRMHKRNCRMDGRKTWNIVKDILGENYQSVSQVVKLISQLKSSMADWEDRDMIEYILERFDIEFDSVIDKNEAIALLPVLKESCKDATTVDFDDMVWLPVELNLPVKHYDVVFVDEAQDFNEVQRRLILKACNGGRMIVVGDPKQAIYGFRGADSASMDLFKRELENSSRSVSNYTLSITWRCPSMVVDEARRFFKDYHAREDAPIGTVASNVSFNPKVGDLVLCRVNAPLVGECLRLISRGTRAKVLGREIGKGLEAVVKKVTADKSMEISTFMPLFNEHISNMKTHYLNQDKQHMVQALNDKADCIRALIGQALTVDGLIKNIEAVFKDKKGACVTFSTIHKAKGLEANNVWILKPDLMPHPMAKSMADKEQERNLCYVAITRAKVSLNYVGDRIG